MKRANNNEHVDPKFLIPHTHTTDQEHNHCRMFLVFVWHSSTTKLAYGLDSTILDVIEI